MTDWIQEDINDQILDLAEAEADSFELAGQSYGALLRELSLAIGCDRDAAAIVLARLADKGYTIWSESELDRLKAEK